MLSIYIVITFLELKLIPKYFHIQFPQIKRNAQQKTTGAVVIETIGRNNNATKNSLCFLYNKNRNGGIKKSQQVLKVALTKIFVSIGK